MAGRGDPAQAVRLAGDAGFDGLAIGADCVRRDVTRLCASALAAGLQIPVMAAPLPEEALAPGRRLPFLAALDDSDERRNALSQFGSMLELAGELGCGLVSVHLGDLDLAAKASDIAYRFARRELEEDEPGERLWASALGQRRALSGRVMDVCRHVLDRILPRAERRRVALALEVAGGPWSVPSPREALDLMVEYRDGPVGLVIDDARLKVLSNLGLAPNPERRAHLAAAARLWRVNDAVGMETGFLPGLGDPTPRAVDFGADQAGAAPRATAGLPVGLPIVVTGRPDTTSRELSTARDRVAGMASELTHAEAASRAAKEPSTQPRG